MPWVRLRLLYRCQGDAVHRPDLPGDRRRRSARDPCDESAIDDTTTFRSTLSRRLARELAVVVYDALGDLIELLLGTGHGGHEGYSEQDASEESDTAQS